MFGLGPIPAVRQAQQLAGWYIYSTERVEISEAVAAIAIVVARELGLPDDDIGNVEGGVVAHDHPIGATGAVLTTKRAKNRHRASPPWRRVLLTMEHRTAKIERWILLTIGVAGDHPLRFHREPFLEAAWSDGLTFQRGKKAVGPVLDVVV
jgi:acetyl-CoA acetyltransferase